MIAGSSTSFMDYTNKYLGEKLIKEVTGAGETPSGVSILSVEYADGTKEKVSSLLLDKIVSEASCDVSALRDKRLNPIVEKVLELLRDWGLKLNELSPLSILLNQSIDYNHQQALNHLWGKYMQKPLSPESVDMLTIDTVLKEIEPEKLTFNDIINKQN